MKKVRKILEQLNHLSILNERVTSVVNGKKVIWPEFSNWSIELDNDAEGIFTVTYTKNLPSEFELNVTFWLPSEALSGHFSDVDIQVIDIGDFASRNSSVFKKSFQWKKITDIKKHLLLADKLAKRFQAKMDLWRN